MIGVATGDVRELQGSDSFDLRGSGVEMGKGIDRINRSIWSKRRAHQRVRPVLAETQLTRPSAWRAATARFRVLFLARGRVHISTRYRGHPGRLRHISGDFCALPIRDRRGCVIDQDRAFGALGRFIRAFKGHGIGRYERFGRNRQIFSWHRAVLPLPSPI